MTWVGVAGFEPAASSSRSQVQESSSWARPGPTGYFCPPTSVRVYARPRRSSLSWSLILAPAPEVIIRLQNAPGLSRTVAPPGAVPLRHPARVGSRCGQPWWSGLVCVSTCRRRYSLNNPPARWMQTGLEARVQLLKLLPGPSAVIRIRRIKSSIPFSRAYEIELSPHGWPDMAERHITRVPNSVL
jgi:hypothetical protein